MADIGVVTHYEVKPNVDVHKLWCQQQIAEKETRIKRLEADIEEIVRAKTAQIQAQIIMLKRETAALYERKDKLDSFSNSEVIDIKMIEKK